MTYFRPVGLVLVVSLFGCTSGQVWVISESDVGGKLGYYGFLAGPNAKDAIAEKIACRPYELNEDVEKSREAAGAKSDVSKVPDASIEDWHEVSYSCLKASTP